MTDRIETLAIHAGQSHEPITGAVMQPVFQTSTYAQAWPAKHTGYEYARTHNPTREALERCVAELEQGRHGIAFGSGLAATTTIMQMLRSGNHVVCGHDLYGGTYRLFNTVFSRFGLTFSSFEYGRTTLEEAIPDNTTLVWIETPTNPLLKVFDIAAIAARTKAIGAIFVVDNTFATPIFQQPLTLGADIVVHSTTKYINGHSDVVGGICICSSDELGERLRFLQNAAGAVPGPWDAWLTLRGIKTLALRMQRHQQNAQQIVAWLRDHKRVRRIHYPLLDSDPGYEIASKQMTGFSGMVSVVLDATLEQAERICAGTRLFTLAESLGGVESLIELPASMTHASIPVEIRQAGGIEDGLIRLSIGIEHADDLIEDLDQAINQAF